MRSLPTTLIKGLHGVLRSKGRQKQADDAAQGSKAKRSKKIPSSAQPTEDTAPSRRWRLFRARRPTGHAKSCRDHAAQPEPEKLPIKPADKEENAELKVDLDNVAREGKHGAPSTVVDDEPHLVAHASQERHPRSDSNSDVPSTSKIVAPVREWENNEQPALVAPRELPPPTQSTLSSATAAEKLPPLPKPAVRKLPLPSLEPAVHKASAPVETAVHKPAPQSLTTTVDKPASPSHKPAVHKQIPPPPSREATVHALPQLPLKTNGNKAQPPSLGGAVCTPSLDAARHLRPVAPVLHNGNALPARRDETIANERPACAVKNIGREHRASASVPKYKAKLAGDAGVNAPNTRSNEAIVVKADEAVTASVCDAEKRASGDDYAVDQLIGASKQSIRNHNSSMGREPLRTRADLTVDNVASNALSAHTLQKSKNSITSSHDQKEQAMDSSAHRDEARTNEQPPVDDSVNAKVRDTTFLKKGRCESKKPPQRTDEAPNEEPPVGARKHKVFEKPTNRETNVTKPGTRDTAWKKREQETKEPIWVIEARMREAFVEQSSRVSAPQQPPHVPRQPHPPSSRPPSSRPPPRQPSRAPTRPPVSPLKPTSRTVLRPVNRDAPYPDSATSTPEKMSTVSTPSPASSTRRGRRASPDAPEPPPKVQALLAAAENGDLRAVASMLETVDVDSRDPYDGYSALTIASEEGRLEIVQYLLQHGANLHQRDAVGRTALFAAAVADRARVVAYLVDKGADPRIVDNEGRSVFWACCAVHASDAAVALLDAAKSKGIRIDIDARDPCGLSAVEFAAHRGHADILQLLRQRGAKEDFKKSGKGRLVIND